MSIKNLFNQKSTKRVFSDDEYKKFVKDKKNQGVRYRLQLGAKNNSVFTLKTIKDLTEEHTIFPLKGMIEQLDKLISRSEQAVLTLRKWNKNNNLGEKNGKTNKSTT